MTERLLQFIWQHQYFNKANLVVEHGESLQIIDAGSFNQNQGPDFTHAKIIIGSTIWSGNIELHLNSSDWIKHAHTPDKNYANIILHVVWNHDTDITDLNGSNLSTLVLQPRVQKVLLDRYQSLLHNQGFVPCQQFLPVLDEFKWSAWKERLAIERLQRKSRIVSEFLKEANHHWEEVFWWMLARNFGIKVNTEVFEAVAKSISINILAKHKNQIHQLEALLLGQAGLLNKEFDEDYPKLLQREYQFLQKKYSLKQVPVSPFFLRMRPANFPTLRLAQLAMLVHRSSHLFSKIKETESLDIIKDLLDVTPNDYWLYHYLLDEPGSYKPKPLGKQMVDNIIINTVVTVLFFYGSYSKDEGNEEKAITWLSKVSAEKNSITNKWIDFGVTNANALESQALIELKNNYCNCIRCLDCAVGNALLRKPTLGIVS